jgi:hypothetical protein
LQNGYFTPLYGLGLPGFALAGSSPYGDLAFAGSSVYGTAYGGGSFNNGVVFCVPFMYVSDSWQAENNALDSVGDMNGMPANITYTTGFSGYGFQFNGVNSSINFGTNAGNIGTNNFGIDFFIQTTSTAAQSVLSKNPSCSHASMWDIRLTNNGTINFAICANTSGTDYQFLHSTAVVNDGNFHEVTAVRLGVDLYLYIDGQLNAEATTSTIANISNSAAMMAGTETCTTGLGFFTGVLDGIKLYHYGNQ